MELQNDDPVLRDALLGILSIETSQKFSVAPMKVRRSHLIDLLNIDSSRGDEVLKVLKQQGLARFVLFGCVELTTKGRLAALQELSRR